MARFQLLRVVRAKVYNDMSAAENHSRSLYLYVSNKDSKILFPENNASSFRVRVPEQLILNGQWLCGLVQIKLRTSSGDSTEVGEPVYITSSLVTESIVGDNRIPVLRQLFTGSNFPLTDVVYHFDRIAYVPIRQRQVQEIDILIQYADGNKANLTGNTYCILHLVKAHGWRVHDPSSRFNGVG